MNCNSVTQDTRVGFRRVPLDGRMFFCLGGHARVGHAHAFQYCNSRAVRTQASTPEKHTCFIHSRGGQGRPVQRGFGRGLSVHGSEVCSRVCKPGNTAAFVTRRREGLGRGRGLRSVNHHLLRYASEAYPCLPGTDLQCGDGGSAAPTQATNRVRSVPWVCFLRFGGRA